MWTYFFSKEFARGKSNNPKSLSVKSEVTCGFNQNQSFLEKPLASLNRGFSFCLPSRHMLCLVWLFPRILECWAWPESDHQKAELGSRGGANMDGCYQLWKFQHSGQIQSIVSAELETDLLLDSYPTVHWPSKCEMQILPHFVTLWVARGRVELSIGSPPGSKEALGDIFIGQVRESKADDRD